MTDKAQEFYENKKASKIAKKEVNIFAMWSFILSLSPIWFWFLFWIPFLNIILGSGLIIMLITSIILGIISLLNFDNKKHFGKGYAIGGIIISILFLILIFISFIIF